MNRNIHSNAAADELFMQMALEEARAAVREGEIPIGAVVTAGGRVVARAHNRTERLVDVTAHAEIIAVTAAASHFGGKYLPDCTLYVTVEPCLMCAGALAWAQIGRVVYGTADDKRGTHTYFGTDMLGCPPMHRRTQITAGVLADECRELMQSFFRERR